MGVATGYGCKEVYRFPHTRLVSVLFAAVSLLFHFLMFLVLVPVLIL